MGVSRIDLTQAASVEKVLVPERQSIKCVSESKERTDKTSECNPAMEGFHCAKYYTNLTKYEAILCLLFSLAHFLLL